MAHPCAAPPSARIPAGYPGILTLFSAAKCLPPKRHQPAPKLYCVLLKKARSFKPWPLGCKSYAWMPCVWPNGRDNAITFSHPLQEPSAKSRVSVQKTGTTFEAIAPLLLQGLSTALRLLRWARRSTQGCVDQFGADQGWSIPERSVSTTWKPKAPRQRREDCPAAAEGLGPAPHPPLALSP
jgi:hypothetical protein